MSSRRAKFIGAAWVAGVGILAAGFAGGLPLLARGRPLRALVDDDAALAARAARPA